MSESPIERRQREFAQNSQESRPVKTAGSEYLGVLVIMASIVLVIVGVYLIAS